jgi:hypothetical protein
MATDSYRFHYVRVAASSSDPDGERLEKRLQTGLQADLQTDSSAVHVWGVWRGMFGVGSDERVVVLAAPADQGHADVVSAVAQGQALDTLALKPTVRPLSLRACSRPGLYVFRRFMLKEDSSEEFAALSVNAWRTFETSDQFESEPQGLFYCSPAKTEHMMLLVTWYDSLASWQTSRQPHPDARENFVRRRALTRSTSALACVLAPLHEESAQ